VRLEGLPIFPLLPKIAQALRSGSLVLSAETGAGKTSAVPAYLASETRKPGRILVLEPRRLAAVSAAVRVAELLETPVGELAGYRVRGDSKTGHRTVVEFVTEGVFLRMIQDDPLLSGVSVVVFDEFHERSANSDLGLAFAREAVEARGDLAILVMSATMDSATIAAWLDCPVIVAPGRLFPVSVSHRIPLSGEALEHTVARSVAEALGKTTGDILVFLPGLREIGLAGLAIRSLLEKQGMQPEVETVSLHGGLSLGEQRAIVMPSNGTMRRVVLATNVAETSLTVPRITAVVDAGLSRFVRFHAPSGLNRLVTERVSLAEAVQRTGRAGRLEPGLCIRCWDEDDALPASRGPELSRMELSSVVLECAVRGARSLEAIRWLDPPPSHAWDSAVRVLRSIGLLDASGKVTGTGIRAASAGIEPRSAAAILGIAPHDAAIHTAIMAAAVMQEREGPDSAGDFRAELEYLQPESRKRVLEEAARLAVRLSLSFNLEEAAIGVSRVGNLLAPGFPDKLARHLADNTWEFSSGRRARSRVVWPATDWLLAVDVDAGSPLGYIRRAAPVEEAVAISALGPGASESLEVEWRGQAAAAWKRIRHGVFTLTERRLPAVPRDELASAFVERLRASGLEWLAWNQATRSLVDRTRFLAARKPGSGGIDPEAWTDAVLADRIGSAAGPYLASTGPALDEAGLAYTLASLFEGTSLALLDAEVPEFITTPGGRTRRPVYPSAGPARLSARVQEFFGMAQGPRACGEPITIELLSPADRPLQVTNDLASFWKNTYPSLRAELARRYPKHYWPLDPHIAEPCKGPLRRSRKTDF